MTQTVLYYPTISIPNTEWLRQALFFFDKVASIAPRLVWDADKAKFLDPLITAELTPELEYLQNEGVYEPLDPESLTGEVVPREKVVPGKQEWSVAHRLRDEFEAKIANFNFQAGPNSHFVRLHPGKLHGTLLPFLERKGLLKYDVPRDRYAAEWFLVEERTALLYMSMLAQALSDIHPDSMVPGTDQLEYEKLTYGARTQGNSFPCIETRLRAVLPVPRPDVAFSDILAFKQKRQAELLQYRAKIDELQDRLKEAETPVEVRETLRKFEEAQRRELANLTAVLDDAKIARTWGSLKTLSKASSPAWWGAAAVAAGLAASIATLSIPVLIAGAAVAGVIEVRAYLVEERNKTRASERASPFAYLYHARAEGIL